MGIFLAAVPARCCVSLHNLTRLTLLLATAAITATANATATSTAAVRHGPVTILVVMSLVLLQVGPLPAATGLVAVLLTIPVQRKCAQLIGALRRQMVRLTDSRVALISEVLQVIRAVKL